MPVRRRCQPLRQLAAAPPGEVEPRPLDSKCRQEPSAELFNVSQPLTTVDDDSGIRATTQSNYSRASHVSITALRRREKKAARDSQRRQRPDVTEGPLPFRAKGNRGNARHDESRRRCKSRIDLRARFDLGRVEAEFHGPNDIKWSVITQRPPSGLVQKKWREISQRQSGSGGSSRYRSQGP